MIDSIGLGKSIANLIYFLVIIIGISGLWIFLKKKYILFSIFLTSLISNLFLYLFLMGEYQYYSHYIYVFINKYWPLINILIFLIIIIKYFKNKK